jgi:hypothetical protein
MMQQSPSKLSAHWQPVPDGAPVFQPIRASESTVKLLTVTQVELHKLRMAHNRLSSQSQANEHDWTRLKGQLVGASGSPCAHAFPMLRECVEHVGRHLTISCSPILNPQEDSLRKEQVMNAEAQRRFNVRPFSCSASQHSQHKGPQKSLTVVLCALQDEMTKLAAQLSHEQEELARLQVEHDQLRGASEDKIHTLRKRLQDLEATCDALQVWIGPEGRGEERIQRGLNMDTRLQAEERGTQQHCSFTLPLAGQAGAARVCASEGGPDRRARVQGHEASC